MSSIEILAVIFAGIILIKIFFIICNPGAGVKIGEKAFNRPKLLTVIFLVLTVIVGYYVFQSITIVEVSAVMLLTSLIIGLRFIPYSKPMVKAVKNMANDKEATTRHFALSIIIGLGLALWTIYEVFVN